MLSLTRSRLCSAASVLMARPLLLVHNSKVLQVETERDGNLRRMTGLESGFRVRAYAGARIGQVGVVMGMRNNAIWMKWGQEHTLEAYALPAVPRMDLRVLDSVELQGLDPKEYEEGDLFIDPTFTSASVLENARSTKLLDDASVQHLINEEAVHRPCQRCLERQNLKFLRDCVEEVGLQHDFTEKLIRNMTLETATESGLTSKDAIEKEITETRNSLEYGGMDDAEIFARILAKRWVLFQSLSTVRVLTQEFKLPNAVLRRAEATSTVISEPWAASVPHAPTSPFTILEWKGRNPITFGPTLTLRVAAVRMMEVVETANDEEKVTTDVLGQNATEEGQQWFEAILKSTELDTVKKVREYLRNTPGRAHEALSDELEKTRKNFESMIEVKTATGETARIPACIATSTSSEVQIIDAPWCRSIIDTHRSLNALKQKELESLKEDDSRHTSTPTFYGKTGTLTKSDTFSGSLNPAIIEQHRAPAKAVLHQLALYRGSHLEPQLPNADVFILDGQYNYLDKACAKELYADVEDPPTMFEAEGMQEYKTNSWHQPFNMVNEQGLEQFARAPKIMGKYARKSVFSPAASPAPFGH
eukprot:TRINITY_DN37508_c0_g1_i1.p1 TRINITY_DN37508_c0_g1~~TRINITY_DN37508_c0_g1_i1.p1  ORF type:complete len:590 (+),score=140.33 TRINITY_DN37508_c0_g1_i1:49-1818(+)